MCSICDLEKDSGELLMENIEPFTISSGPLFEHGMTVDICRDAEGRYMLKVGRVVGGDMLTSIDINIDYCPFCGRELEHWPKRELK